MSVRRWVIFLLVLAIISAVWLLRLRCVNYLQMSFLKSITKEATLSNEALKRNAACPDHKIYTLKGIERFFPHRVNSLQRLRFLYNAFQGFECDIHFIAKTKQFFIAHDDVQPGDPTLLDYLRNDSKKKIFWLDVKNLTAENIGAFCNELLSLDKRFDLKNRLILESTDKAMADRIAGYGFFTSFYVPLDTTGQIERKELSEFCRNDSLKISTASQDIFFHSDILSVCSKKQLTWDIGFLHSFNKKILLRNANDSTILVCLLNIKSPGYR